jgi:hypothetical protein
MSPEATRAREKKKESGVEFKPNRAEQGAAADRPRERRYLVLGRPSPREPAAELGDYEAVGESSLFATFLPPNLPAEQRRWLAGGPGGGQERPGSPHGWGEICGMDASPTADNALGMHSTIRAAAPRGRSCAGPGIRMRRAAPSFGHPHQ